jgi:RNA polymerase sigma-70 factor (ECF subfamily)
MEPKAGIVPGETTGQPDDAALVASLRRGDPAAFEALVRTYGGRLLAVGHRFLRNEEDARDAVQEAFISAFRSIDRFEGNARLSTWLHRIVVNAALMKLRAKSRNPEEAIDDLLPRFDETGHHVQEPREWHETGDAAVERRETREIVRSAIGKLPESYRSVLLLRDIEEMDTEETASLLGITENAVKIRLHRARLALRTLLDPHFSGVA